MRRLPRCSGPGRAGGEPTGGHAASSPTAGRGRGRIRGAIWHCRHGRIRAHDRAVDQRTVTSLVVVFPGPPGPRPGRAGRGVRRRQPARRAAPRTGSWSPRSRPGPVETSSGLAILRRRARWPTSAGPIDTLVVVGGDGTDGRGRSTPTLVGARPPPRPAAPAASPPCAPAPSCSPRPACSTAAGPPPTGRVCDLLAAAFPAVAGRARPDLRPRRRTCTPPPASPPAWTSPSRSSRTTSAATSPSPSPASLVLFLRRPGEPVAVQRPARRADGRARRPARRAAPRARPPRARLQRRRPRPRRRDERAPLRPLLHRRGGRDPGPLRGAGAGGDGAPAARGHRRGRRGRGRARPASAPPRRCAAPSSASSAPAPREYRSRFRAA